VAEIYLALLHYPVLNKSGDTICASISNLDIHDISRAARTYGVKEYYLVHPDPAQAGFLLSVLSFWNSSDTIPYNPDRADALSVARHIPDLDTLIQLITTQEEARPIVISTTARPRPPQISFPRLRSICAGPRPVLILFGTGHGLRDDVHQAADHVLAPIEGRHAYNHLSVRSAAAIILDRVASEKIHGRNNGYSAPSWQRPNQNRLSRVPRWGHGESPL